MSVEGVRKFALIGKSGAGKSTVANQIARLSGARRVSTGAICRSISKLLFANEDKTSTQRIDDALTIIDPSIFLKAALRDVKPDEAICVDSLRFASDYQIARSSGFEIIRVVASDKIRAIRLSKRGQVFNPDVDGRHRSETDLDDVLVDFTIENDGTEQAIEAAVRSILCTGP